jgi:putative heme-binding domain-containing protein
MAPEQARPVTGDDWQAVRAALTGSGEPTGDPQRGRAIYEAKACSRCHDGGSVGPDLAGVTGRFSRDDLFLAITDPDRDVSSRYRGTLIQTTEGQIVSGLVAYESADGVTLKDGEKTWRFEADEIEFRRPLETSLMPRGLLKDLRSQDLADLEAYLRTIGR